MRTITLIEGDGIGPEITAATKKVLTSLNFNIEFEEINAGITALEKEGDVLPSRLLDSIRKNKVALKAPVTTPIGEGFRSVNVALRKELNLYAALRPAKSIEGIKTRYENIDLLVVRENTEDLYAGIERKIDENTAESIKIITREASENIVDFAFQTAVEQNRKKVTAVTKANICKLSDGLFLDAARTVSKKYPNILYEEVLIDNMCMQLVQNPENYDVLVLPNLYGDIISDLTAGLVGGLGVAPGANYGKDIAVFEPVHGSSPSLAGLNKANPTAMFLSAVMMLDYLGEKFMADKLSNAVMKTIKEGIYITADIGGSASTDEFTEEVIKNL